MLVFNEIHVYSEKKTKIDILLSPEFINTGLVDLMGEEDLDVWFVLGFFF